MLSESSSSVRLLGLLLLCATTALPAGRAAASSSSSSSSSNVHNKRGLLLCYVLCRGTSTAETPSVFTYPYITLAIGVQTLCLFEKTGKRLLSSGKLTNFAASQTPLLLTLRVLVKNSRLEIRYKVWSTAVGNFSIVGEGSYIF